ncbi:tetratricopeptide repeat protein [Pseudoalteromonas sp. MMG012]|uniref:tetratricopeptide repeat protein n=1 Tax=Pseudoalteromonas sp. MMG012 TaxID=2822686 RepID=UPI001B3A5025|nr:SEL1-like repeat protein [Pseudoalteromonas sp. MMG012]MBQ4850977.1 sel1 repeat family protein [Pseudoalteromonas sp. MMG012]
MSVLRLWLLLICAVLAGCKSTGEQSISAAQKNQRYMSVIDTFRNNPERVSYNAIWRAYLASSFVRDVVQKDEEYKQILIDIAQHNVLCTDINWFELTRANFWSVKPHLSAQSCFESYGDLAQARYHASAVALIESGIRASGNGNEYYSAYEVMTWADAFDMMERSDHEIIDIYLQLAHAKQAIYLIYVVNDPVTGLQKEIYFENNQFIHSVLGVQYPFGVISNLLETQVIDPLVIKDTGARLAKAQLLTHRQEWEAAVALYNRATQDNSPIAYYKLGVLCLNKVPVNDLNTQCESYFTHSADMGYLDANIALALMYEQGIGVEPNITRANEYMTDAEQGLSPGDGRLKYAWLYKKVADANALEEQTKYIEMAASEGSLKAKYYIQLHALQEVKEDELVNTLSGFSLLAEQGLTGAQSTYAELLLRANKKGSDGWLKAKKWIDKAAQKHHPHGDYLKGLALKFGYFDTPDKMAAYLAFRRSALNYSARAQLELGRSYQFGEVVSADQDLAISWYLLCANKGNKQCLNKAGQYFRRGLAVEQSDVIARSYFELAAELGYTPSMTHLAQMYIFGDGGEQNLEQARVLYNKACDKGYSKACVELGLLHRDGDNLKRDSALASKLFNIACDNNYMTGCHFLAEAYRDGHGVSQDLKRAVAMFVKVCKSNKESRSCRNLAEMYELGHGVEKSEAFSQYYRKAACQHSTIGSCTLEYNTH